MSNLEAQIFKCPCLFLLEFAINSTVMFYSEPLLLNSVLAYAGMLFISKVHMKII
uniref:Uncharacterized protein n=1 Tax=Rhizophora mucronata TaxID=61149 RepID=A0A2P2LME2_RHIMU